MSDWHLQIFLVSNQTSQELISGLLAGIDSLAVEVATSDFDCFVIVESVGKLEACEVRRFIQAIDPDVKLIHESTARPVEPAL